MNIISEDTFDNYYSAVLLDIVCGEILFPKHVIIENWMLKLMSILKPIMKHLNLKSMPISKLEFLAFWTYVEGADKKWIDVAMSSIIEAEITDNHGGPEKRIR